MKEASKEFFDAIGGGMGSPSISCSCGRRHVAPDSDFIEDAEALEMKEDAINHPKEVVISSGDGIHAVDINGATFVIGCECNYAGRVEALVWNMRETILDYYRRRRDADAKALASLDEALKQ